MADNKKFKLVYEKQGTITGSYSGIPANDDVALIDKAVLEGKEDPAPIPTGTISITANGEYDVAEYASADVDIEIPAPTGTINITENGIADVSDYANANVSVPQGVFPEGTEEITENGIYDITDKASVDVAVEASEDDVWEWLGNNGYDDLKVLSVSGGDEPSLGLCVLTDAGSTGGLSWDTYSATEADTSSVYIYNNSYEEWQDYVTNIDVEADFASNVYIGFGSSFQGFQKLDKDCLIYDGNISILNIGDSITVTDVNGENEGARRYTLTRISDVSNG